MYKIGRMYYRNGVKSTVRSGGRGIDGIIERQWRLKRELYSYKELGKGGGRDDKSRVTAIWRTHMYICICMHGKPTYKLHTQTYYYTQKEYCSHIIMDPVPKDNLAIGAGKTAETIFSVDNTSDYIR